MSRADCREFNKFSFYFSLVQPFQFKYKDQIHDALAIHFTEDGYNRYKITFDGGVAVVAPAGIHNSTTNAIIWVQSHGPGDVVYPHELIQAIGEDLEEDRIY